MFHFALRHLSFLTVIVGIAGCGNQAPPQDQKVQKEQNGPEEHNGHKSDHGSGGHSHQALHGGQVQAVGNNHFELVYAPSEGRFTLFVLGSEENEPEPIP